MFSGLIAKSLGGCLNLSRIIQARNCIPASWRANYCSKDTPPDDPKKHGFGKDDTECTPPQEDKKEEEIVCPEGPPPLLDLTCKTAVITGGTSGIGKAAASEILSMGAKQVALIGIDDTEGRNACLCLNNMYGNKKALFYHASVACIGELEEAFKKANDDLGGISMVVNSAGVFNGAQWEKEIVTNVVGMIRCTLLAYKYMSKDAGKCGGVVINVAGLHALEIFPEAPTFCCCNHAVLGFSRSFAAPYHEMRTGVRVLTLLPGFTKTELFAMVQEKGMTDAMGEDMKAVLQKAKLQMPSVCGLAIGHLLKFGKSGSVWIIKGSNLYLAMIPEPKTYSTIVAQYIV